MFSVRNTCFARRNSVSDTRYDPSWRELGTPVWFVQSIVTEVRVFTLSRTTELIRSIETRWASAICYVNVCIERSDPIGISLSLSLSLFLSRAGHEHTYSKKMCVNENVNNARGGACAYILGRARNRSGYATLFLSAGRRNVIIPSVVTITESEVHSTSSIYRGRREKAGIEAGYRASRQNSAIISVRISIWDSYLDSRRSDKGGIFFSAFFFTIAHNWLGIINDSRYSGMSEITCSRLNTHVFPSGVLIHWIVCYRSSLCARLFGYTSRARSGHRCRYIDVLLTVHRVPWPCIKFLPFTAVYDIAGFSRIISHGSHLSQYLFIYSNSGETIYSNFKGSMR